MPPENLNMEELTDARRKAVEASIRTIEVDELKKLGEELFPFMDDPWRERYFEFLAEHAGATVYHATTHDRVHVLYCPAVDRGLWFLPGHGLGPLQPKALTIMKEIVGAH
jgi:hypothetical protein